MSNPGGSRERPEREALKALEKTAVQAAERLRELRARARDAEARSEEFQELLKRFTADEGEAGRLLTRLRTLETENADLRDRLDKGREGVERMLARVRFLEEQR